VGSRFSRFLRFSLSGVQASRFRAGNLLPDLPPAENSCSLESFIFVIKAQHASHATALPGSPFQMGGRWRQI